MRTRRLRFQGSTMNTSSPPARAAKALWPISLGLAVLSLATFTGCQGFSSAKAAATNPTPAGELGLTPATETFGTVQVGSSQQQSGTVTNTGGSPVTISQ